MAGKPMRFIRSGGKDTTFGKMVCMWDEKPAVLFVKERLRPWLDGLKAVCEGTSVVSGIPDESEIEKRLDAVTPRIYELFDELAPTLFYMAQYMLATDVEIKVIEEQLHQLTLTFRDGSKRTYGSILQENGVNIDSKHRNRLDRFFTDWHHELIGVQLGRKKGRKDSKKRDKKEGKSVSTKREEILTAIEKIGQEPIHLNALARGVGINVKTLNSWLEEIENKRQENLDKLIREGLQKGSQK